MRCFTTEKPNYFLKEAKQQSCFLTRIRRWLSTATAAADGNVESCQPRQRAFTWTGSWLRNRFISAWFFVGTSGATVVSATNYWNPTELSQFVHGRTRTASRWRRWRSCDWNTFWQRLGNRGAEIVIIACNLTPKLCWFKQFTRLTRCCLNLKILVKLKYHSAILALWLEEAHLDRNCCSAAFGSGSLLEDSGAYC